MNDRRLGLAVRARRHQRGWRLVDLAAAAGVGPGLCSLLERGFAARLSVRSARAIAGAVGLPLEWDVGWQRQELSRLLDADHSALAALWVRRLADAGWIVRTEVSFNRYGDRGRIDILAYHPVHRVLLVIEIKAALVDAQELLGGLDVKARVAPFVARELGWDVALTVPAIVIADSTTARRHLARIEALFGRYTLRGQAAQAWVRKPSGSPTGLLTFSLLPSGNGVDRRRSARSASGGRLPIHARRKAAGTAHSDRPPPNGNHVAGWRKLAHPGLTTSPLRTAAGACAVGGHADSRARSRPASGCGSATCPRR